ncbi:hypothetical protein [Bradyrhizobium sp. th.b2]|uniref:hypothetical protein n=1 Tax=Bradyrhizobium sp. th-b2 TaxID=172088 RepID=UPI00042117E5|nr:hypothetical protein [Bradyrhizobium sp. th.b2]
MEQLFSAAHAASRMYSQSWRRGNIVRCQSRLRQTRLTKRLIDFYLDEIEREIDFIIFERDAA